MSLQTARALCVQTLAAIDAAILAETVRNAASAAHTTAVQPAPAPAPSSGGLTSPAAFYDHLRGTTVLGPVLTQSEVAGCEAVLAAAAGRCPASWAAYCLGTTHHETGGEMAPNVENLNYTTAARIRAVWPSRFPTMASAQPFVRNARGLANHVYNGRMGNRPGSNDGWDFRGRGQSHITGRENYERADAALGLNGELVRNPDKALEPDIAAKILVLGMLGGWFTGKKLNDFIPAEPSRENLIHARKIINPDNNGPSVADVSLVFLAALKAGGWK